jgi:amino acid transporter
VAYATGSPGNDLIVKRNLSLLALVSVIFFNVCAGPYALEPVLNAGPGLALLLIVVTPLVWGLPVAMVCAELGSALPEEGGYYAWSKRSLGPFWAFCQGWWAWLFTIVDLVLYPMMFCDYLSSFLPAFGTPDHGGDIVLRKGLMIGVIWVFIFLNLRGAGAVGRFTELFAVLLLSPLAVMVVWGLWRAMTGGFPYPPAQPFLHPGMTLPTALAAALPYALWNYQGWDAVSTVAGEMDNPRRNYPRGLFIASAIIAAVYTLPAFVGLAFVGPEYNWEVGSWGDVAQRIAGPWVGHFVSLMGMASGLGLFASLVLGYSRLPLVIAEDGYLPKLLTTCNSYGAPTYALLLCGTMYTGVVIVFNDFEEIAEVDVTMFASVMVLELASFLALRLREPQLPRTFRVPGGWGVAIVFCTLPVLCVSASIFYRASESGVWPVIGKAALMMASGPALYPFLAMWRRTQD